MTDGRPKARLGVDALEPRNAAGSLLDLWAASLLMPAAGPASDGGPGVGHRVASLVTVAAPVAADRRAPEEVEAAAEPARPSAEVTVDDLLPVGTDDPTLGAFEADMLLAGLQPAAFVPAADRPFGGPVASDGAAQPAADVGSESSPAAFETLTPPAAPFNISPAIPSKPEPLFTPQSYSTFCGPGPVVDIAHAAQVTEVDFRGDVIRVEADPGDPAYPTGAEWQDANADGTPEVANPIGYPRGSTIEVAANFKAFMTTGQQSDPQSYWVWGRVYAPGGGGKVPETQVTLSNGYLTLPPTTVMGRLPGHVAYGSVGIEWWFSRYGKLDPRYPNHNPYARAGTSGNELYVTLDTPAVSPVYHTVIHTSTTASHGATDMPTVVDKTWAAIADREVYKVIPANLVGPPAPAELRRLHYYLNWSTPNETTEALLRDRDGQCKAWTNFFVDTLKAHGEPGANQVTIVSNKGVQPDRPNHEQPGEGLLIKNWSFVAEKFPNTDYPHANGVEIPTPQRPLPHQYFEWDPATETWRYVWATMFPTPTATDQPGIPGQGTTNPKANFSKHFLVQIDGKYYDPSYGIKKDTLLDWENAAVEGFSRWENNPQLGWLLRIRTDPAGQDVKEA